MSGSLRGALTVASWNVARLPAAAIALDLGSDARVASAGADLPPPAAAHALTEAVREVLGLPWVLPTHMGRGADAVVASLVGSGEVALSNEVYLTARWSIERFGGAVVELPDLDAIGARLDARVRLVWVTAPRALLGPRSGEVVSFAALSSLRRLLDARAPGVPLVLDATRLVEHAVRLLPRAERVPTRVAATLGQLCALADIAVLPGAKDAGGARGGLVAARDGPWLPALREAALRLEGAP
ncbi:MAG: beta-eliminating lyase-related protein, partial [Pseudomonadota bacterium]